MKNLTRITTFIAVFSTNLLCAEPSAFGAGDLNNPQPYGLTSSEKAVLENKNQIKQLFTKTKNHSYKVDSLRERIDGLQSIIESLTQSSRENELKIKDLLQTNEKNLEKSNEYEKRVSDTIQANSEIIDKTSKSINELELIIKDIEVNYVSKDDFNNFIAEFNSFKKLISKSLVKTTKEKSKKQTRTNWEILKDANRAFEKKSYDSAIKDFELLVKKKFKPAYSNYVLGEIYYKRKSFAEAIAYFKLSASLYSDASYMATLMLHTAISMELTGDKKNAKNFYNAIVSKYPQTKESKIATTNLEAL